jgi:hypothetical protein
MRGATEGLVEVGRDEGWRHLPEQYIQAPNCGFRAAHVTLVP